MIISGKLLTPTGEPLAGARLRLTATATFPEVLKFSAQEVVVDQLGEYSIDVPVGRYRVDIWEKSSRGFVNVGIIEVSSETTASDINTLLMVNQTSIPRDPLLGVIEGLVESAQEAASDVSSAMQELDTRVDAAITEALDGFTPRDGVDGINGTDGRDGVDGVTPQLSIGTVAVADNPEVQITGTPEAPILNITLPKGAKGDKGDTGPQGPQGPKGERGDQGATGPQGEKGPAGPKGEKGDKGDVGERGPQGPAGADGAPGQGVPVGGTTGQLLAKSSNADYATTWVDAPTGTGGGTDPALESRVAAVEDNQALFILDVEKQVAARWPKNQQWAGGAFSRWAFGITPQGGVIDAVTMNVDSVTLIQTYIVRLWLRDLASAYTGGPDEAQGDTLVNTINIPASTFPQVSTHQDITFRFPQVTVPADKILIFDIQAQKPNLSFGPMGVGRVDGVQGIAQVIRGYYNTTGTTWALISASGAAATIAFVATAEGKALDGSAFENLPPQDRPAEDFLLDAVEADLSPTGLSVVINGRVLKDRTESPMGTTVSVTAAPTGRETKTVNLVYATDNAFVMNNANTWLGRRNISSVVVKRTSDSAVLVENTDYAVNYRNGKIRGLINKPAFEVSVAYSYAQERYDLLQYNMLTNAINVKAGTARDFDAQEYVPTADAGNVPIGTVLVIGGAISEVLPTWQFDGIIEKGTEQDWDRLRLNNRRALAKTLGKLARGAAITVAGYGDSITAFQTGAPTNGSQYQANGQWRDRDQYFVLYPTDTKTANLAYYDTGDGAGAVHIRKGWNWKLVEYWRSLGSDVTYLNFGIGSTASANVSNGGLWPARLAPVLSSGADVCVIGFGMNELGQAVTMTNVISIIQQMQAVGIECVVMGVPQITDDNPTTQEQWRLTNHALQMAARFTKSAFVPTTAIADQRTIAGMGISFKNLAASNLYNHPGFRELDKYGELLIAALS